jgi:hypothetical protein
MRILEPEQACSRDTRKPVGTGAERLAERARLERLGDTIATLASEIEAATARFLRLLEEFDRCKGWNDACARSCAHWVSWRCGISLGPAREYVRVARRLPDLPLIREAFERGALSFSKVRAVTRLDHVEDEQRVLDLARASTASQLERMVRAYRGVVAANFGEMCDEDRRLTLTADDDGAFTLRGKLRPEEGALLQAALRAVQERLFEKVRADLPARGPDAPAPQDHDRLRPTLADALMRLVETSRPDSAVPASADRFQVVVHVDSEALAGEQGGVGTLDDGTPVPADTVRRICCGAAVIVSSERNGRIVKMGRKTRAVPPALRRALRRRDGGCRFPGCSQRHGVDAHHIQHWAHGGRTDLENLVELCQFHHRALHDGRCSIVRRGGCISFHDRWGKPIPNVPSPPGARGSCATHRVRAAGVTTHGDLLKPSDGGRMDLQMCVDALGAAAPHPDDPDLPRIRRLREGRLARERRTRGDDS